MTVASTGLARGGTLVRMAKIFISHAGADEGFVGEFVDTIVIHGCGADADSIFCSSDADMGVRSGSDINAYIHEQVTEADVVVALITPAFRARPYCMAELGAAWSRAGSMFPLTAGVAREQLDGVLKYSAVRDVGTASVLDELRDRITPLLKNPASTMTWNKQREKWLRDLEKNLSRLARVRSVDFTSVTSCSRVEGRMEVFWTDTSRVVWYRYWENDAWSGMTRMEGAEEADYVAAVCPEETPGIRGQMLFGVSGIGKVWIRRWTEQPSGVWIPGPCDWIAGEVSGPLGAVSHGWDVELFAWRPDGSQCHLWRDGENWSNWATVWQ
jgi:TIR domain